MSKEKRYWHLEVGYNYRMTNLQAAIGVAQLEQFDQILGRKLELAEEYDRALAGVEGLTLPPSLEGIQNSHWLYTVIVDEEKIGPRDELMRKLTANGIETRPVFYPLHEMPIYKGYAGGRSFPVSKSLSANGLSLPSSAALTKWEVDKISSALRQIVGVRQMSRY
jgi:perosamine synthetase